MNLVFSQNGQNNGRQLLGAPSRGPLVRTCPESDVPAFLGRALYPAERCAAAGAGLISDDEFVADLIRHVLAENARTIEGETER